MKVRWVSLTLLMAGTGLIASCGKSDRDSASVVKVQPSGGATLIETIMRVHWLGKQRIAAETNSTSFVGIWNLPQTVKLEQHFLDQLSLAPGRSLPGDNSFFTNTVPLLRPLLEDLIQQEFFLEVARVGGQSVEMVLGIRLDDSRVPLWKSNLTAVCNAIT